MTWIYSILLLHRDHVAHFPIECVIGPTGYSHQARECFPIFSLHPHPRHSHVLTATYFIRFPCARLKAHSFVAWFNECWDVSVVSWLTIQVYQLSCLLRRCSPSVQAWLNIYYALTWSTLHIHIFGQMGQVDIARKWWIFIEMKIRSRANARVGKTFNLDVSSC